MTNDDIVDFLTLFRGRGDCYGSWEGSCVREPLNVYSFEHHLGDGPYIGVYPAFNVDGVAKCVWGCVDIDKTNDASTAFLLRDTFESVDVTAWVERTDHGFHVWVFTETLVPAADMRNMFLAACQVAQYTPKEINPKQTVLRPCDVGNYVRLPYNGALVGSVSSRTMIGRDRKPWSLWAFVEDALHGRTTPERVRFLADHYRAPTRAHIDITAPTADMEAAARGLTSLGRAMWRDGPAAWRDRSTTLQHMAYECAKAGLNPADALMLVKDADLRWGKYSTRADQGETELSKLVQRAYGATAST